MIGKYVITIVYSAHPGGVFVGVRQIYQGFRKPAELLNPLFGNKIAIRLFTVHIVVVSCDLFVIGPLAVAHKSPLYYWGGRCLLVTSALPIAAYLNRNPQSFGTSSASGSWCGTSSSTASTSSSPRCRCPGSATTCCCGGSWPTGTWTLARGLLQRLYDTPEKQAARP